MLPVSHCRGCAEADDDPGHVVPCGLHAVSGIWGAIWAHSIIRCGIVAFDLFDKHGFLKPSIKLMYFPEGTIDFPQLNSIITCLHYNVSAHTCSHLLRWIPEISTQDFTRMEPVCGIEDLKDRWELSCCVCRQRMGAKIQCSSCYTSYHPLCGR